MKTLSLKKDAFTIVEIMVVVGIVSILSVGFIAYLYQESKQTKESDSKLSYSKLQNTVLSCAQNPKCLKETEALTK